MRITLAYAALAGGWIVVSDLVALGGTPGVALSIAKGLFFVAVTGLLLQLLIERAFRRSPEAERARAAAELAESEARLHALVDQSISGIYVIQDGRFAYVNPRMATIFGYDSPAAIVGLPVEALVAPEDRTTVAENIAERLAGHVQSAAYGFHGLRKDGRVVDIGVHGTIARYDGRPAILGTLQDITERKRIEDERIEHLARAQRQIEIAGAVSLSEALLAGDVHQLAREITETAAATVGVERANVWLFNADETELRCIDDYRASTGEHGAGAVLREAQYANEFQALKSSRYVAANDPHSDPRTAGYAESYLRPLGITAMLDAVIQISGRHLGLLCLEHVGRAHAWEQDEIAFACQLADKLALALAMRQTRDAQAQIEGYAGKLEHAMQGTLEVVAKMVELRDPYTRGHERRVGEICAAIAGEMGLDDDRIEGLRVAGGVHDVGKIAAPAEILSKPTRLTPSEYALVKEHAQLGYEILKEVEFPWPVAEVARQHHERIDGSGYPRGLKDGEILLEARILAVADTVEAMSSHRPYRPGLGIEVALAEIERGAGTGYDRDVAAACLRLFREKGYTLPA
ncbi:MAG: HD domain-containing phosphohydrolase [Vicinamibacteria bacterium]